MSRASTISQQEVDSFVAAISAVKVGPASVFVEAAASCWAAFIDTLDPQPNQIDPNLPEAAEKSPSAYPRPSKADDSPSGNSSDSFHTAMEESLHPDDSHDDNQMRGMKFGQDYIELADGSHISTDHYFGPQLDKLIYALDNVEPIKVPDALVTVPHPWQLKGAAQAQYLCHSMFRGMICGDQMGLGKTLLAIMAMYLAREEPGSFSLVVCPKSCQLQWLAEIKGNFEPWANIRVFILEDRSITAHQLLADKYDIVIVSYEFVESNWRSMRADKETESRGDRKPKRVIAALHSKIWRLLNLPIKRLVLDEVQRIKKHTGRRYAAVQNLFYYSAILLSGTFLDNKWLDVYAPLSLIQGHALRTMYSFKKAFASYDYDGRMVDPEEHRIRFLQKLLLCFVIARPSSILQLPEVQINRVLFKLDPDDAKEVKNHFLLYTRILMMIRAGKIKAIDGQSPLVHAIRAQLYSLHPSLAPRCKPSANSLLIDDDIDKAHTDEDFEPVGNDDIYEAILDLDNIGPDKEGSRADWLKQLAHKDFVTDSGRVLMFLKLYTYIRAEYPNEKIVVFSFFLKFLDIMAVALEKETGIKALRYDGTVAMGMREHVRAEFKQSPAAVPLFITVGAGGVGLNITDASIVVQGEIWWNHNLELQAQSRCHRQGQKNTVKVFKLVGQGSPIDGMISACSERKTAINERLMGPLLRKHDESVSIPKIIETRGFLPLV